jgi:nucleoside-diphosphate-sugar epimerase
MKVFITGGESFVGARLWEILEASGHEVSGIDAVPSRRPGCRRVDLRDAALADAIPEGATVVHLAAISTDPLCRANPLESLDVNITGTIRVAQAAIARGCPQLVFASTEWVYGDVANDGVQLEDDPIDVTRIPSAYAFSKVAGERVLAFSGLPNVTVLRFGIIYGPRGKNWSAVESLADSVVHGRDIAVGSLGTSRRFIHVDDLCAGIAASFGRTGFEVFNLAGAALVSLGDVITSAAEAAGRSVAVTEKQPGASSVRNPVSDKAMRELAWKPELACRDGIRRIVKYLEERKSDG